MAPFRIRTGRWHFPRHLRPIAPVGYLTFIGPFVGAALREKTGGPITSAATHWSKRRFFRPASF